MDVGSQGRLSALKAAGGGADVRLLVAARCGIYMLLGGVMSCSRVLGDGAPFGMAMVACSGPGISGVFALTGAALGYLLGGGLEWGIRYIAAAVLVYTVSFVFHELEAYKSSFFMPTAAGLVMGLTGFLGSFSMSLGQLPAAAEIFLEVNLAFGGTYFFREALSGGLRETETAELRHSVSVMIMSACALMAFSRIVIFDTVSIGRFMALVLVMTSAMKGGMLTGAAVGTVLGLAMDVSSAGAPFYTMAYSFAGLLSGVFGKHGRVIFVLSFILAGALSVVCAWTAEVHINALFETFCASVVFMLLPNSLLNHVGLMLQHMERGSGESGLRRFAANRVRNLSEAYAGLFETVRRSIEEPGNDENVARIFDRAADEVCVRCRNKNRCWNAEYVDTLSAMNDATQAMVEHGGRVGEAEVCARADYWNLSTRARARLGAALARWEGSALRAEALSHGLVRAEVPFFCRVDSPHGRYLEGSIDLLATDAGSDDALLVDYKTGDAGLSVEEVRQRHQMQAEFYADVLAHQGFSSVTCVFVCVEREDPADPAQPLQVRYRFGG